MIIFLKRLFCRHDYKITYICYQERYQTKECSKCSKEIYEDID